MKTSALFEAVSHDLRLLDSLPGIAGLPAAFYASFSGSRPSPQDLQTADFLVRCARCMSWNAGLEGYFQEAVFFRQVDS